MRTVSKQMVRSYIAEYIVNDFISAAKDNRNLLPTQIFDQLEEKFLNDPQGFDGHHHWSKDAIELFHEIIHEVKYKFDPLAGNGIVPWLSTQHLEMDGFKGYVKFLFQTDKDGQPDYNARPILLFLPDPYVPPYIRFGKNLRSDTILTGKKLTEYRKLLKEAIHNYVDRHLALPRQVLAQNLKKQLSPFAKVRGVKGRSTGFGGKGKYEQIKPPLGMSREQYLSREGQIKIMQSAPIRTIKNALQLPSRNMFQDYLSGRVPFVKFDHPRFETFLPAMAIGYTLLNDQKEYAKEVLQDKLRFAHIDRSDAASFWADRLKRAKRLSKLPVGNWSDKDLRLLFLYILDQLMNRDVIMRTESGRAAKFIWASLHNPLDFNIPSKYSTRCGYPAGNPKKLLFGQDVPYSFIYGKTDEYLQSTSKGNQKILALKGTNIPLEKARKVLKKLMYAEEGQEAEEYDKTYLTNAEKKKLHKAISKIKPRIYDYPGVVEGQSISDKARVGIKMSVLDAVLPVFPTTHKHQIENEIINPAIESSGSVSAFFDVAVLCNILNFFAKHRN